MSRETTGRLLVTAVAFFWTAGAWAADFNDSHVFNSAWTAHARFHSAFQLVVLLATTAIALRAVWSNQLPMGVMLIALYPCAFFVTPLVPGVAFSDPGQPLRQVAGIPGQLVMAAASLCLLALGTWLGTRRLGAKSVEHSRGV